MEAIILMGLPGSGKSTFYERHFASTHLRISRDIAATRPRELRLLKECLARRMDFVVDNTNLTTEQRKPFVDAARAAGYKVTGYLFLTDIKECLARNARRLGKAKVPVPGVYRARKQMQLPAYEEGFDAIYEVQEEVDESVRLIPRH